MCCAYVFMFFVFPVFFNSPVQRLGGASVKSIFFVIGLAITTFALSEMVPDKELGNRVEHTFSGGFAGFLICFLAAKDCGVKITKLRFFFYSFLIVLAWGVANEICEFFVQTNLGIIFSPNVNDTWWDLTSNTAGILIAVAVLMPLTNRFLKTK